MIIGLYPKLIISNDKHFALKGKKANFWRIAVAESEEIVY